MRWRHPKDIPLGTTRIIRRFAIWPTRLNDETRWLEFVKIKQVFTVIGLVDASYHDAEWYDREFVD